MKIPDPKFQHGQEITATAERYNSGCPVESEKGHITEMRFILYEFDAPAMRWEYEITFSVGKMETGATAYKYLEADEADLLAGITYGHKCEHQGVLD